MQWLPGRTSIAASPRVRLRRRRSIGFSDELATDPGRFLMCVRGSYGTTKLFDKVGAGDVTLVWSM
jgi:hypothetical protein